MTSPVSAELLDMIEHNLASPMVTYAENANHDAPLLVEAAKYALEADKRIAELEAEVLKWKQRWARHSCGPRDVLDMD